MAHRTLVEIEAAMAASGASPRNHGRVRLIVARPAVGERRVLDEGVLDVDTGLVGDNWWARGSKLTMNGTAHFGQQVTLMNSRMIQALTGDVGLWPLAGDQLYVDLDLSERNLKVGRQLRIGAALVEVSEIPHNGCAQFTERFGHDAIRWVNSAEGRAVRRRGVNVTVMQGGVVRVGDVVSKVYPGRG